LIWIRAKPTNLWSSVQQKEGVDGGEVLFCVYLQSKENYSSTINHPQKWLLNGRFLLRWWQGLIWLAKLKGRRAGCGLSLFALVASLFVFFGFLRLFVFLLFDLFIRLPTLLCL